MIIDRSQPTSLAMTVCSSVGSRFQIEMILSRAISASNFLTAAPETAATR
jgi:hypothetical protein